MHTRERDNLVQTLQFPDNQYPMCPWTSIADVEMISVFLGREFGAFVSRYEVSELGLATLEFTGFVVRVDPVGDVVLGLCI